MVLDVSCIHSVAPVYVVEETTSTMDDVAVLAKNGAEHLTCTLAEKQDTGRGRRGRVWQTFPETSIAMSIVVRKGIAGQLPLIVSLAVFRVLKRYVEAQLEIKWPNDILLEKRKVAGILVERGKDCALLGIGINVKTPHLIPHGFEGTVLEESAKKPLKREDIISAILAELGDMLTRYAQEGWGTFAQEYERVCGTIGQPVCWHQENEEILGIAIGLNKDGTLELKTADGTVHTVVAGDIIVDK